MVMKGLFVIENYSLPNFQDLKNKGVTDIFFATSLLLDYYSQCKTQVQNVINAIGNVDINLWIDVNCFLSGSTLVDPHDMTHRNAFCNALTQLITDFPRIEGITLEDYDWQDWTVTSDENETLASYARQMATAIHNVHPYMKFAPTSGWSSPAIPQIALESDLMIAQCYHDNVYYPTQPTTSLTHVLNEVDPSIPVIPILGTIYTPFTGSNVRSATDILGDIIEVLNIENTGYILYAYPWIPSNFNFPQRKTKYLAPNLFVSEIE